MSARWSMSDPANCSGGMYDRRAEYHAGGGQAVVGRLVAGLPREREAEVGDLHERHAGRQRVAGRRRDEEQVRRLDVAVIDAEVGGVREGRGGLPGDRATRCARRAGRRGRCARPRSSPSSSSIAKYARPSWCPQSYTPTMFGCLSFASETASFSNRASAAADGRRSESTILSATTRSSFTCRARNTTPHAPLPRTPRSS